jgi:hypothetical protein
MKTFLYALQVYNEEIPQAIKIARLLSEFAGDQHFDHADCCIVYRRDCPESKKLESIMAESFETVHTRRSARREVGFPGGSNGVWCDLMDHSANEHSKKKWSYKFVLTTEVDALPIARDWQERLLAEWDKDYSVVGCWHENGEHAVGHINGNAMFHPMISRMSGKFIGCAEHHAWDTWFADEFERIGWKKTKAIQNLYRKKELTEKEFNSLIKDECVWLHGVKDDSALDLVRNKILKS